MQDDRADITRRVDGGRAYPLGEPGRPARSGRSAERLAQSVAAIVDYLDVANPAHLREVAGFGVLVKLLLVGLMALQPAWGLAIFWMLLGLSTLLSHAPGNFRHRKLF